MKLKLSTGLAAGFLALAASPALAAPVTVNLRIEGPTRTLFEGPVTTDVRPFQFTGDATTHTCDGSAPAGTETTPKITRGAVLTAASQAAPFTLKGTWSTTYGSPSFTEIAGENVDYDPGSGAYLAEFLNGTASQTGSCGEPVSAGDTVLYAYSTYEEPLLALSGPTGVRPGSSATLKVTDLTTGTPVAGASVDGKLSGADGTVVVGPLTVSGDQDEKATKDGFVRSNRVRICVTNGADGFCGTRIPGATPLPAPAPAPAVRDTTPPAAKLSGFTDHQVFTTGPRELRGSFGADPSGLAAVKLRLTRRVGGRCWYFSGKSAMFRGTHCGRGSYFTIGTQSDWTYLLPAALGRGRYVLDAVAVDRAGNRTPLARGTTRVVFTVR
jgi:hypothetical protein